MSLFAYYDGTEVSGRIRLGQVTGLIQAAEKGTLSTSAISLDDPSANLTIVGLKSFNINEADATPVRLFSGFTADRDVDRFESGITGAARRWDITLNDLNYVFGQNIIDGSNGNRPEETDIARISWLRSAGYLPLSDNGLINTASPVTLDAADYRGQYPLDVISECSEMSGKNFWAYNDDPSGQASLAYFLMTTATYASALRLTNDAADVDSLTTFAARVRAFKRNPDRVYSKVYLPYVGGAVSVTRASTEAAFGARGVAAPSVSVKTASRATTLANRFLDDASTEDDRITVEVQLPTAKVNDILPGHRVEVKFTHLPGYTSYTWTRVVRRTVKQSREDDTNYQVEYELNIPKLVRFHGTPGNLNDAGVGGSPVAPDPNIQNAIDEAECCEPYIAAECCDENFTRTVAATLGTSEFPGNPVWTGDGSVDGDEAILVNNFEAFVSLPTITIPFEMLIRHKTDSTVTCQWFLWLSDQPWDGIVSGNQILFRTVVGGPILSEIRIDCSPGLGTNVGSPYGSPADVRGVWVISRVRLEANACRARSWRDNLPEPNTWHAEVTNLATFEPTTFIEMIANTGAAQTVTVDWICVSEGLNCAQDPPRPGQTVNERVGYGDGTTVAFTTDYPYRVRTLKAYVDSMEQNVSETDPSNGAFVLEFAPASDELLNVRYAADT